MELRIGVVGATGIVGSELVTLIEERKVPIKDLKLFASDRSDGKSLNCGTKTFIVENLTRQKLVNLDYLFFCSSEEISKEFIPTAISNGICCIDNSSAFRQQTDVPLVIPEVNPEALSKHKNIISNPNCSTIIALMVIAPLHKIFGIKRFCCSTYQAVSGVGLSGLTALEQDKTGEFFLSTEIFGEQILYNAIPKIGKFFENGYSSEEMKMLNESRKILSHPTLKVSCSCVRIPVLRAHSMAVIVEFEKPFDLNLAEKIFSENKYIDFFPQSQYPSPVRQSYKDNVGVGRLRMDTFMDNAASMWIVGDQVRKGAALNAIQIMEILEIQKQKFGAQEGSRTPTSCDTAA